MGFEELLGVNPWTAAFTLANTLAVFFVAKKFLFLPVMQMIQQRQQEIDDMYAKAELANQEAAQLQQTYTDKLAIAAQTGEQMVKDAVARGRCREEEIIRQANDRADAILQKANADIAREKKKAVNEAKDEITVIAMDIAGKVVGRSLTVQDQTALVDDFIEELGDGV